jgi:4-carboxymuconolactone decarboxylase
MGGQENTMRLHALLVAVAALASLAAAQQSLDIHLRGDRFAPLTYDAMTPQQKLMVDHLLAGERGGTNGPFNVTLRDPEMGDAAQKLGAQLRFHTALPNRLNEMAILMTARYWNSQYEWYAHHRNALTAGLSPAVIDAIAQGKRPAAVQPDEEIIYNFASEMLRSKQVSDAAFKAVVEKFGERGAVDLTGVMGYYCFVSMMLNVDRYPLPEGAKAELQPLP